MAEILVLFIKNGMEIIPDDKRDWLLDQGPKGSSLLRRQMHRGCGWGAVTQRPMVVWCSLLAPVPEPAHLSLCLGSNPQNLPGAEAVQSSRQSAAPAGSHPSQAVLCTLHVKPAQTGEVCLYMNGFKIFSFVLITSFPLDLINPSFSVLTRNI